MGNLDHSCGAVLYLPVDDCPAQQKLIGVNFTVVETYIGFPTSQNPTPTEQVWFTENNGFVEGYSSGTTSSSFNGHGIILTGCELDPNNNSQVASTTWNAQISVFPIGNDGAISAGYQESWNSNTGYNHPGGPTSYSAYVNPPCQQNSNPNETSSIVVNYTNNTASPQVLPNGQVLQPGQGTAYPLTWPNGSTGSFSVTNQNPDSGQYNDDTGQWSFGPTNLGNYITTTNYNPQSLGANSDYLAYSNAGPIIWQPDALTNPALATAAGDSAIVNGENNLQNALNNDLAGLSNLLSRPLTVNVSNNSAGNASNVWVMNWPTNFGSGGGSNLISISNNVGSVSNVWVQNWPTNIDTNSALGMTFANTNQAGNVVAPASQQITTLSGMVPNSLADNSGAAEEQDITITPPGVQPIIIAMGVLPSTLSTTFSQIRGVIAWFIIVMLAIWNFVSLFRTIKTVSLVPQGQGPDTGAWAALGSNVMTALVVASAIVAVISTIPVFAVGLLAGEMSFASDYSNSAPLNFFNQMGWGFQFLSQYLPIYLMFTAFGVRVVYYFGLEVLAFFACIVIKLLIGV